MKRCNACGNMSKEEVVQCPYCGSNNFTLDNSQPQQQFNQMGQMPMGQQPMQQQMPMGQPMPGYGQQPMPGYNQQPMGQMPQMPGPNVPQVIQEKGNIAWGILGFFIPIVGWILYFVWKNSKPADAKVAGMGGIIGFCFNVVVQIIL